MTTNSPNIDLAFCTIVSKNYMARARALAESIRQFHPGALFDVLLVDRVDGAFDPSQEEFGVTLLEDLPIPEMQRFCFQYNILELNTAAKPYYLETLFNKTGTKKLVYFDPDILVLDTLDPLSRLLDHHSAVLTPHTTVPYPDGEEPREVGILRAGVFNLGFIALKDCAPSRELLTWWQKRLYSGCRSDLSKGFHVDQKWMDLAPIYFEGIHTLKAPGYNIATWNFHAHPITSQNGKFFVGGEPLRFFHFSAFDPFNLKVVSKYQHRYTMDNIGDLKNLFHHYSQCLMRHDFAKTVQWPYAYGFFNNGKPIPQKLRDVYLLLGERANRFGNPFATEGKNSLYSWWVTQGESMKKETLTELLERDPQDWKFEDVFGAVENLDVYDWFRRSNPKPQWRGAKNTLSYLRLWIKFAVNQIFMQWLPPLFAKQFILNRVLIEEIRKLRSTKNPV